MTDSLAIILLGCALIVTIIGCVTIVILDGSGELLATGLGALTTLLAGALIWRVKNINGKSK